MLQTSYFSQTISGALESDSDFFCQPNNSFSVPSLKPRHYLDKSFSLPFPRLIFWRGKNLLAKCEKGRGPFFEIGHFFECALTQWVLVAKPIFLQHSLLQEVLFRLPKWNSGLVSQSGKRAENPPSPRELTCLTNTRLFWKSENPSLSPDLPQSSSL